MDMSPGKSRENTVGQETILPISQKVRDRAEGHAVQKETHTTGLKGACLHSTLSLVAEHCGASLQWHSQ